MVINPVDVSPAIVIMMNAPFIRVRKEVYEIKRVSNPVVKM